MKVKITKCSGMSYWYRDEIGKIYEVVPFGKRNYEVIRNGTKIGYYIGKNDCEIVTGE